MKIRNFLYRLVGVSVLGYASYVVIQLILIAFASGGESWQQISGHLIVVGVLSIALLISYFLPKEKSQEVVERPKDSEENKEPAPVKPYNPLTDKLRFGVYQQSFKNWWFDNDGDKHEHDTLFASLRFYQDGVVTAIRSSGMPKREVADSYTMKGSWTLVDNKINFQLDKVSEVDDSIVVHIPEQDKREMKYYGEIADDNSLIKAGTYKGVINENTITIRDFVFADLVASTLIVTAEEEVCELLESRIKGHPDIIDTFQDTGNWYSNGETGPEWFTVHIRTPQERSTDVEALVRQELKNLGKAAGNLFWS